MGSSACGEKKRMLVFGLRYGAVGDFVIAYDKMLETALAIAQKWA